MGVAEARRLLIKKTLFAGRLGICEGEWSRQMNLVTNRSSTRVVQAPNLTNSSSPSPRSAWRQQRGELLPGASAFAGSPSRLLPPKQFPPRLRIGSSARNWPRSSSKWALEEARPHLARCREILAFR